MLRDSFGQDSATALRAEKQAFKSGAATQDFAAEVAAFRGRRAAG